MIDDLAGFKALRPAWEDLHARDPQAGVFLSWDWLYQLFADNHGQWRVLAATDPNQPDRFTAFLPLRYRLHWSSAQRRFQAYIAAAGRLCFSEYTGFVCDPDPLREAQALTALGQCAAQLPWARLSLRYEPTGHRLVRFAAALGGRGFDVAWPPYTINDGATNQLLCPQIALPASHDAYLAGLSRNTRKKIRKATRRHIDSGVVRVGSAADTDPQDVRERLLALWSARWAAENSPARLDLIAGKYRTMMIRAEALGLLYMPSLWRGDRMLGALAFVIDAPRGMAHCLLTGRDDRVDDLDIGLLMHSQAIHAAISAGLRTYDFGHGTEAYKYHYGAVDRAVGYLAVTRRDADADTRFDPLLLPQALARTAEMLGRGRTRDAQAALSQLARAAAPSSGHSSAVVSSPVSPSTTSSSA
ncbi:GNAT family N-acetyltransferase [Sulfitobacter sabulilitoris]|uniref:GNAT family N-acetyltransferase n=1 Tax=Sulfitobacter sabulilitoris TaxID=2562655 RepID=UPI001478352D|nr:GNAT family N-acetyltransferase [Sulfitobacter sabulilitoris]